MKYIQELYGKYKEVLLYLIFGVLTTIINTITYYVLYDLAGMNNVMSNTIAWLLAVIFAFTTNKLFVFESKSRQLNFLIRELLMFMGFRLFTGLLDLAIMFTTVDLFELHALLMKIISNIVVIILNYIASKLIVFKKTEDK